MARKKVFDPVINQIVSESDTTSGRYRNKLREPYWWFCELCDQPTEYKLALDNQGVFRRLPKNYAKYVSLTDAIRREAQQMADSLVERYKLALDGEFDASDESDMRFAYCDILEMGGDYSVDEFREQVERYAINFVWARHGDMLGALRLPKQPAGAPKPSRLYCSNHNPRRDSQARRNYQRDRSFAAEFQELISTIRSNYAGKIPLWDIAVHARIRREAYNLLVLTKQTIHLIDKHRADGITNQAKIARRLGLSRQAVSIALKRHAKDDLQRRKEQCKKLVALSTKIFDPSL